MNKAEEKANELIKKFRGISDCNFMIKEQVKCALICVDNIIDELYEFDGTDGYRGNRIDLYLLVRIILENKLK